jgi:rhodanese-related sulfurtransferase
MSTFADAEHELEPREVERRVREDGWTLIDVREPHEREAGYVAGTRHVELERLASQADTIDREHPVVFLCQMGSRSGMATQAFRASGYDAYNLRGGITAWVEAGLPIEPEDGHVAEH